MADGVPLDAAEAASTGPSAAATLLFQRGPVAIELGETAAIAVDTASRVLGLALLAGLVAAVVALVYRWYVRERSPSGLPLLFALAVVSVALGTTDLLAAELQPGSLDPVVVPAALNIATFVVCAAAARGGARIGDRVGTNLYATRTRAAVDADVSEIVQTVGRVTAVELPDDIDDIVGYDPVAEATKDSLAGRRFLLPKRLSPEEVRDRLTTRLKTDYGVGHVDAEVAADGSVTYLAVGQRAAGIGPTLPPATSAVAIRADPANAAAAGDLVQVWEPDPARRVVTAEVRGVAGDVVTLAVDADDATKLDPEATYRLVTLPVQNRSDREFASVLRAADETLATITVGAGSDLDGVTVGSLSVAVAAVARPDAQPDPIPARDRVLAPGDVLYAVATPDALRKLEAAAAAADERSDSESDASAGAGADASADPDGATDSDR